MIRLDLSHNDAFIISIQIAQAVIDQIVDECNASNVMQLSIVQQMSMLTKINKSTKSLTGFNDATSVTMGIIDLDVYSSLVISLQTFMIINEVFSYNGILGRPWIGKINPITSATYQKIRYQSPWHMNSDQVMTKRCSMQGLKQSKQACFTLVSLAKKKGKEIDIPQ